MRYRGAIELVPVACYCYTNGDIGKLKIVDQLHRIKNFNIGCGVPMSGLKRFLVATGLATLVLINTLWRLH